MPHLVTYKKIRTLFSLNGRKDGFFRLCEILSFGFAGVALAGTLAFASQRITQSTLPIEGKNSGQSFILSESSSCERSPDFCFSDPFYSQDGMPVLSPISTLASKGPMLSQPQAPVTIAQYVRNNLKGDLLVSKKEQESNLEAISLARFIPSVSELEKSFQIGQNEKKSLSSRFSRHASEQECLATAIYYEAGSESDLGKLAVANVIINRSKNPAYPSTICGVVYQGAKSASGICQFSFACEKKNHGTPNRRVWLKSKEIAEKVMREGASDIEVIATATHFHADYVKPEWASAMRRLIKIGRHIFYSKI